MLLILLAAFSSIVAGQTELDEEQITQDTVHAEEPRSNIYLVSQPIDVNYIGSAAESEVKLDKKNVADTSVRMSMDGKSQSTKKPQFKKTSKRPTQKDAHKKIIERPTQPIPKDGRLRVRRHVKHNKKAAKISVKSKIPLNIRIRGGYTKIDAKPHTPFISQLIDVDRPERPLNINVNVNLEPQRTPGMHPHRRPMGPLYSERRYIAPSRYTTRRYTTRRKTTRYTTRRRITSRPTTRKPTTGIAAGTALKYDVWLKFGECEYMVKRNAKNYDDAEATCRRHGAHLVSIHSEAENNFIHKITSTGNRVRSFEEFVWIGLRINSRNEWEWVDGSPLNYKKWAVQQPDHPGSEKCAQLHQGPASLQFVQDYYWNSLACERPMKYYVCKKCKRSHHYKIHRNRCCCCHSCRDICSKCDKPHNHECKQSIAQPTTPKGQVAVFPGQEE